PGLQLWGLQAQRGAAPGGVHWVEARRAGGETPPARPQSRSYIPLATSRSQRPPLRSSSKCGAVVVPASPMTAAIAPSIAPAASVGTNSTNSFAPSLSQGRTNGRRSKILISPRIQPASQTSGAGGYGLHSKQAPVSFAAKNARRVVQLANR